MGKVLSKKRTIRSSIRHYIKNADLHIDNVKNSLEHLIFSNEKEFRRRIFSKRIKLVGSIALLFITVGLYFAQPGKANVVTFFPDSCLGGWTNYHNAEGKPETEAEGSDHIFNEQNSALLPAGVRSTLYCGSFVGEIEKDTKPTKILITLAWHTKDTSLSNQTSVLNTLASSSNNLLEVSSTSIPSLLFSSSSQFSSTTELDGVGLRTITESSSTEKDTVTESTSSNTSLVMKAKEIVGDFFNALFTTATSSELTTSSTTDTVEIKSGTTTDTTASIEVTSSTTEVINDDTPIVEQKEETVTQDTSISTDESTVPQESTNIDESPASNSEPVKSMPQDEQLAPDTNVQEDVVPLSYFETTLFKFSQYFIEKVFAEEATTTKVTTDNVVIPKQETTSLENSPSVYASTTDEAYITQVISPQQESTSTEVNTEDLKIESTTESQSTSTIVLNRYPEDTVATTSITTILFTDSSSTRDMATSTAASTSSQEELPIFSKYSEPISLDTFEVFYTFDGTIWSSLGVVDQNSIAYRNFEIPLTASSTWNDMSNFQIKIEPLQRTNSSLAVYLDGIKVEVLYENSISHIHPDFERDTILTENTVGSIRLLTIINNDTNKKEVWYMDISTIRESTTTPETSLSSTTKMGEAYSLDTSISTTSDNALSTTSPLLATDTIVKGEDINKSEELLFPKNVWLPFEGDFENMTTEEIIIEINKNKLRKKEKSELPDFTIDTIKKIKGTFLNVAVLQIEKDGNEALWLYNIDDDSQINITATGTVSVSSSSPIGVKDGYIFWLSKDNTIMYSYNIKTGLYEGSQLVPSFDASRGERPRLSFPGIPWEIIIGAKRFTFYSKETGEVFSNGDSKILDAVRERFHLEEILTEEKLQELDYSIEDDGSNDQEE